MVRVVLALAMVVPVAVVSAAPDGGAAPERATPIADHVIIVSEDGLRPDALVQAKAPTHQRLMREGSYSLTARTIRRASTLPSHAAMLSGFDVKAHGLDWNSWKPERGFIKVPTVFTAANSAGRGTAAFVGKRKLEHIAGPGSIDVFSRPGFFCRKVAEEAAGYFVAKRPQVEFVHFSDPDESGHSIGWMSDEQLIAITAADRCLARLVAAVESTSSRTLLIISSDHGGVGRNHSGRREEDRVIPWIAWGAGVRRGHKIRGAVSTVDTAATALWALGYAQPVGVAGRVVREAFTATATTASSSARPAPPRPPGGALPQ